MTEFNQDAFDPANWTESMIRRAPAQYERFVAAQESQERAARDVAYDRALESLRAQGMLDSEWHRM